MEYHRSQAIARREAILIAILFVHVARTVLVSEKDKLSEAKFSEITLTAS